MITYKFLGNVPNNQIIDFYKQNNIDCFITTSESEGLPVSIMEAESSGIPIIATDVGGISEMIANNGILLPANPTREDVAEAIIKIMQSSSHDKRNMSNSSRLIWEKYFDAEKNAKKFIELLVNQYCLNNKKVFFLTEGYPYYNNEKSFLEEELKALLEHYEVTIISRVSSKLDSKEILNAQKNIDSISGYNNELKVMAFYDKWSLLNSALYSFKYLFDRQTRLERKDIFKAGEKIRIRLWESIKYYSKAQDFYKWFKKQEWRLDDFDGSLMYSYWNTQPFLGLCMHKNELPNTNMITRLHGYDYQDERWLKSIRKPFMRTIDEIADGLVFVSETGKNYHSCKNGSQEHMNKYHVSYIGSNNANKDSSAINTHIRNSFIMVSCASMIPLKRIDLIIDSLGVIREKMQDVDITWVHFGDGELMTDLEERAKKVLG